MKSIVIVLGLFALLCGCADSSSSGGSSCGQECQDEAAGFGIIETLRFLYNQNLAGQSTGGQNLLDVACPLGGSTDIVGTTSFRWPRRCIAAVSLWSAASMRTRSTSRGADSSAPKSYSSIRRFSASAIQPLSTLDHRSSKRRRHNARDCGKS